MAEPIFDRPISQKDKKLVKLFSSPKEYLANKYGEAPGTVSTAWNTAKEGLSSLWQSVTNPLRLYNRPQDLVQRKKFGLTPNEVSGNVAARLYIPWATKEQFQDYTIPQNLRTQAGGFKSSKDINVNKLISQKWNKYAQDAKKHGFKPSMQYFLAFNTSQPANKKLSDTVQRSKSDYAGVPVGARMLAASLARGQQGMNQMQTALAPKEVRQKQQQLAQNLRNYQKTAIKDFDALDANGKVQALSTAGGIIASPWLLPKATTAVAWPLIRDEFFYIPTRYVANTISQKVFANSKAVYNAMISGDFSQLTQAQRQLLPKLSKGLPSFNQNDPDIRNLYKSRAAQGLESIATVEGNIENAAFFMSPKLRGLSRAWRAGKILGPKAVAKHYVKGAYGRTPKTVATTLGTDVLLTAGTGAFRGDKPTSVQYSTVVDPNSQQMQQARELLRQSDIQPTDKNVINLIKNQQQAQQVAGRQAMMNLPVVKQIRNFISNNAVKSGIESSIQDYINLGSAPQQKLQELRKQLKDKQKGLYSSVSKQEALLSYVNNPQNSKQLQDMFGKLTTKQTLQALRGFNLANKGADPLKTPAAIKAAGNALQAAALQANIPKYQKVLGIQDSDQFFSEMQEWMPLIHEMGGASEDSPLKAATQKAVWAHVKKNPFLINKAMSIWAMSNGFNSLADFLGSNGAFYGTIGAIGIGLPLTISLIKSLFGGNSTPQRSVQQPPMQGYQPLAYAPKDNITEPRLIVG